MLWCVGDASRGVRMGSDRHVQVTGVIGSSAPLLVGLDAEGCDSAGLGMPLSSADLRVQFLWVLLYYMPRQRNRCRCAALWVKLLCSLFPVARACSICVCGVESCATMPLLSECGCVAAYAHSVCGCGVSTLRLSRRVRLCDAMPVRVSCRQLSMFNNQLNGSIPSSLSSLTALT
jgi:hypothetical protein